MLAMCTSLILGEGFRGVGACYASLILVKDSEGWVLAMPNPR